MQHPPWQWDEMLYAGSAAYYAAGRMRYPSAIAEVLRERLELDGAGRLLDVGCGPGSLTLLLAGLFESVVGVDADPDMLAQAQQSARQAGIGNVDWRHLRAEHLPADLGTFRVVTFAQSFHWFDQPTVAARVRPLLAPDGAWVHVHAITHRGVPGDDSGPHPGPPHARIAALVGRYLGPVRRAGRGVLPAGTPAGEEDVMRAAGFAGPDRVSVGGGAVLDRTEDQVVASVFSLSGAAPHLFGDRLAAFESELRALLRATSPDRRFTERTYPVELVIWRP